MVVLRGFNSIRPAHETAQEEILEWLATAHAQDGEEHRAKLYHVGCKPPAIQKRGHVLPLFESPQSSDLEKRTRHFEVHADQIFEAFYPGSSLSPENLIHVTCTGYISPSGAQKLVSRRGWGAKTTVTHAYHMGCYGAIPAIRMARGFSHQGGRTDIVHTEMCSLHNNTSLHAADQLISQTLFSDGFIQYSVEQGTPDQPHFRLLSVREEIIPDSIESMSWNVASWGFKMSLAKELPVQIARALPEFLARLAHQANVKVKTLLQEALFAVHPGGPKILQQVQRRLELQDHQMAHSILILQNFGNMSSATLPHIWKGMLEDPTIADGTVILSLAFGPGLTICGTVMQLCSG
jgi:predicted naringenin-chalcone synthase